MAQTHLPESQADGETEGQDGLDRRSGARRCFYERSRSQGGLATMPILQLADLVAEERWRHTLNVPDAMWDRHNARIARLRELIAMANGAVQVIVPPLSLTDLEDELEWRRGPQRPATQWADNYRRTGELRGQIADIRAGRQPGGEQGSSGDGSSDFVILFVILGCFAAAWLFLYL